MRYHVKESKALRDGKKYAEELIEAERKEKEPKQKTQYIRKMVNDRRMVRMNEEGEVVKVRDFTNEDLKRAQEEKKINDYIRKYGNPESA